MRKQRQEVQKLVPNHPDTLLSGLQWERREQPWWQPLLVPAPELPTTGLNGRGSDPPLVPWQGPRTLPQPLPWSSHSMAGGIIVLCWQDREESVLHTHHSMSSDGPQIPTMNGLYQPVSHLLALSHANHPTATALTPSFHLPTAPFRPGSTSLLQWSFRKWQGHPQTSLPEPLLSSAQPCTAWFPPAPPKLCPPWRFTSLLSVCSLKAGTGSYVISIVSDSQSGVDKSSWDYDDLI